MLFGPLESLSVSVRGPYTLIIPTSSSRNEETEAQRRWSSWGPGPMLPPLLCDRRRGWGRGSGGQFPNSREASRSPSQEG